MRLLELALNIAVIIYALILLIPEFSALWRDKIIPPFLVLLAVAQILVEGFRWQLWPLFIAADLLILVGIFKISKKGTTAVASLAVVFATLSMTGASIFPIPSAFPITGPYQVGTREIHLIDPKRNELYGSDPAAPREFMAQIWYPAEPVEADKRAQWMPAIEYAGPAIAGILGLPPFALNHLEYVQANAFLDASPITSSEGFPVLIFSHGWEGFKEQNIFQVEELASHGYLVIGLNHTYGSVLTVFPDGRKVPVNHEALPSDVSDEVYDLASNTLVKQWAGDIGFVLDQLEMSELPADLRYLSNRVDLSQVGVFGHSTGAGATIEFCLVDTRCQAALAMDLWSEPVDPEIQTLRLTQPALILHSENWDGLDTPERNYGLIGILVDQAANDVFEITIQGTKHYDFSSLPLLSPLAENLGLKGPIDGQLVLEIINAESVAFFDRYLQGDETIDLEELSSRYPEVMWGVRP